MGGGGFMFLRVPHVFHKRGEGGWWAWGCGGGGGVVGGGRLVGVGGGGGWCWFDGCSLVE